MEDYTMTFFQIVHILWIRKVKRWFCAITIIIISFAVDKRHGEAEYNRGRGLVVTKPIATSPAGKSSCAKSCFTLEWLPTPPSHFYSVCAARSLSQKRRLGRTIRGPATTICRATVHFSSPPRSISLTHDNWNLCDAAAQHHIHGCAIGPHKEKIEKKKK